MMRDILMAVDLSPHREGAQGFEFWIEHALGERRIKVSLVAHVAQNCCAFLCPNLFERCKPVTIDLLLL